MPPKQHHPTYLPMTQVDFDHWSFEIVSGMWDPYLDQMVESMRERLKIRAAMASVGLRPGDRVRLTNVTGPYKDLECRVVTNGGGRIEVESTDPIRLYGKRLKVSPSQVIVVPEEEEAPNDR